MKRLALLPLVFIASSLGLVALAETAKGAERPVCAEYTPGRVLAGEFQRLRCDVVPGQSLDLVMFRGKFNGERPSERCDHMGGHFQPKRVRCVGVDF